ncbi:hypothetical protein B0H63DRAFT_216499 [Podospora didyma]|uniref:polynucleotide adenylyltransferase n=1 Tax=Podospora didyma TaxID=330526 RepID=A0AAE0TWE3_9PEZI|nr:hypothetical protein B0H63DRAFT_216499 [Podospora didyma]
MSFSRHSSTSGNAARHRESRRDRRDRRDDRGFSGSASAFVPPPPPPPPPQYGGSSSYNNSLPPRPSAPVTHGDSYRPSSYSRNNHDGRDRDSRYSEPQTRDTGPPGYDNYRPPQSDFSFRVDRPAGLQDLPPSNGYRGRNPRRGDNRGRGRGNDRNFASRPKRVYLAAERELLSTSHDTGLETALYNTDGGLTYRPLEDLTDSDEAEMDISGDEGDGAAEPSNKRARVGLDDRSEEGNSAPKWSNPDPYTVLPPSESGVQNKKKDVVHLIRKARVQTKDARPSLPTASEDFISCDFDDSDEGSNASASDGNATQGIFNAPTGPRSNVPILRSGLGGTFGAGLPPNPMAAISAKATQVIDLTDTPEVIDITSSSPPKSTREKLVAYNDPAPAALGSRKRTFNDEIKLPHARLKKATKAPVGGHISSDWKEVQGEDPCPWLKDKEDHSGSVNPGMWLHKEIVDFYYYIRPRQFEEDIRNELVQDLRQFCRNRFRDAEVHPFGSYPSGLYLPTADMDLVFVSDQYFKMNGQPKYNSKKHLFQLRSALQSKNKAYEGDVEIIHSAKVPLVKYVDQVTGLKVDISFENVTGLTAINTFKAWKQQYPGMPILVTLIKHYLCMRGLNEPVNGGIGGFSVICLVVSMLQMNPKVQSGNMDPTHHYGELLLDFFDLYGNKFNYTDVAISLNPPKYVNKYKSSMVYRNYARFSIIDPNDSSNDIAGGSSNTPAIVASFQEAHRLLSERMAKSGDLSPKDTPASILKVILAGNYSSFRNQRKHLENLAKRRQPAKSRGPSRR